MSCTVNTKYLLPSIAALLLGYGNMGYIECHISIFLHTQFIHYEVHL